MSFEFHYTVNIITLKLKPKSRKGIEIVILITRKSYLLMEKIKVIEKFSFNIYFTASEHGLPNKDKLYSRLND